MTRPTDSAELLFVSDVSPYRRGVTLQPAGIHQSLPSAAIAFEQVATLSGLRFAHVHGVTGATPERLRAARVLALFTIGEAPWTQAQRSVIAQRVRSGKLGLVGVHATADSAFDWPDFADLLGARFESHPVTANLPLRVVDRDHPATSHLPSPWSLYEEFYLFRDLAPDLHVLLAVDMAGGAAFVSGSAGVDRYPCPLAWCIERDRMRTFYTALGHHVAAYENSDFIQHLHGAVRWVLNEE